MSQNIELQRVFRTSQMVRMSFPLRCQNNNNMHRNQLLMQSNIQSLLLYAVTGAGKTEMMFEGIRFAAWS